MALPNLPRPWRGYVLLLGALGCHKEAAPPAAEEAQPAPVHAVAGERVALAEWTELLGTTVPLPDRVARISAAVEGRVIGLLDDKKTPVAEGRRVAAGQVLVRLDDRIARDHYEVLIRGTWIAVPVGKILRRTDNPIGRAVLCWTPYLGFMCFIPGPGA